MNIQKSIEIEASPEKIWKVLLLDAYNQIWFSEFSKGSFAESDWKEGSKVLFSDSSGEGLAGTVAVHIPNEIVSINYHGILYKGAEDTTSEEARKWTGMSETYKVKKSGNSTVLTIELNVPAEYVDMFTKMWDNALKKIKELAEKN